MFDGIVKIKGCQSLDKTHNKNEMSRAFSRVSLKVGYRKVKPFLQMQFSTPALAS